jgi:retron-type reverse transcriptase
MPLAEDSLRWALNHLNKLGDSDLFPRPAELDAMTPLADELIASLSSSEISALGWGAARRFMVPKDQYSFRRATQLNVRDSLILTAIMHEYGEGIENRRRPVQDEQVFSYRFEPQSDNWLYNRDIDWNAFWQRALDLTSKHAWALTADITDFYNQIYHHTVENQLIEAEFPNPARKWTMGLLETLTAKVSRGVPVGPHAAHLLAEATLIPIDNSLASRGAVFIRFVDDVIIFTSSEMEARKLLYQLTEILDKQQRLVLNKSKTEILTAESLRAKCETMLSERPINDFEAQLVTIIRKYSGGNPYQAVLVSEISPEDLHHLRAEVLEAVITDYLEATPINFIRLRWLLRRLSQVGHPGAVDYCLAHLDELTPALADACHYILSASANYKGDLNAVGARIINALQHDLIAQSEYLQLCLISLLSRNGALDHFEKLAAMFTNANPSLRREIILAARLGPHSDWLRELKEMSSGMDDWTRQAYIVACKSLPQEERKFFLNSLPKGDAVEELLKKWAKQS